MDDLTKSSSTDSTSPVVDSGSSGLKSVSSGPEPKMNSLIAWLKRLRGKLPRWPKADSSNRSVQADSPPNSKPIDRWLGAGSIAVGIIFFLLPKTSPVIVVSLTLIFVLLAPILWSFWWVEKSLLRRTVVMLVFMSILVGFGFAIWPNPNREIKEQSAKVVKKIRDMNAFYNGRILVLQERRNRKEIDDATFHELRQAEIQRASEEFGREVRVDAGIVLWDLRHRIPYESRKHIIGLPNIIPADPKAGEVSMYSILSSPFDLFFSEKLADEIEELSKILPPD